MVTARETWKKFERKVAKKIGGVRTPLSGSHSRHTSGDVIHDVFYVECKYRKNFAVVSLFDEVREKAKKEKKIPMLVLKQKNRHGELVVMDLNDFVDWFLTEVKDG
jgi:hypothetical protein